jgi:predicted alpha-1,2-mannosidase
MPTPGPDTSPVELANPLCGTDSEPHFSTGLTYPAVGRPWGMTYFSPRNRPGGHVFSRHRFRPVNTLWGFTATHAPSPWMGEYASLTLLPGIGDVGNVPAEVGNLVLQLSCEHCEVEATGQDLIGIARDDEYLPQNFACHFVVRLDRPIKNVRRLDNAIVVSFESGSPVRVEVATSFIDHDQARLNLQREVGDRPFDTLADEGRKSWNGELSRFDITGGSDEQRRTFYTGLWRALLFPRTLTEPDADGQDRHMSPYTGRVEPGHMVTDNGFWDTSRTVYPLLSLGWPKQLGRLLDGWVRSYEQSGWMPQWASPGHRKCMVGTHSAVMIADAIKKDIGGFDHKAAFDSMIKDATVPGEPSGIYGRQQLDDYDRLGFCPEVGEDDSVCRTLDYAYNDWCCGQVADVLGLDASKVRHRAGNWRHLFDKETRFFRPKKADGEWAWPFREFQWGGPYREGGPWQYRFTVPHDIDGLGEVMGGGDEVARLLAEMIARPGRFEIGTYGQEIHEMMECAGGTMGQYAHSNQPVHGVLWTAARLGRPDVTDRLVRRVLCELYSPDVFPGDEDNGEMGAWYVLASIGLYPHCPGEPSYTTTTTLFDATTITRDDGHEVRLDGAIVDRPQRLVRHQELVG